MSNASFRKYRSLAKAQYARWWPFQLNPSAEAVQPLLPKKELLHLEHLPIRVLLQQPVPKALQSPAKGPCLAQQGCQNIENGGISHPALVKMLSLSGDPEEQQHWRALIHPLLLPAESCKSHSFVNFFKFFFFNLLHWLEYLIKWKARYEVFCPIPLKLCAAWIVKKVVPAPCIDRDWAIRKAET